MRRLRLLLAFSFVTAWFFVAGADCLPALTQPASPDKLSYPATRRVDHVDEYHGVTVADPYRWLEADVRTSPEVAAWVVQQNQVTEAYLKEIPQREALKKRLTELWNYERTTAPRKVAGKYYYSKNDGLQNQSVLYVADSLDGEAKVVLDPNTWSKDGTIALGATYFSDDGRYLAYSVQEAGSDWSQFKVLDLAAGNLLADEIRWVKFSGAAWTKDGQGFFYSRYDEPRPGEKFQSLNLNQKVFYHRVGTPQCEDVLVYARPDQPTWSLAATVTDDGHYLVITARKGTSAWHKVFVRDLNEPYAMPTELVGNFDHDYTLVANDGPWLYFRTDNGAPRGRVIAIHAKNADPKSWKEIIPQGDNALRGVSYVGNMLVCSYLKDAFSHVKQFDLNGQLVRDVKFPGIGSAMGFGGRPQDTETFFTFMSFATPPSIYRHNLLTGESTLYRAAKAKINPGDFEVKQVFYPSKDGTKIPLFVTYKKGIKLDGMNPTLLYGYGGFNIPQTPMFSIARVAWLEQGGVLAVACLRGGGEYGKDWHLAGTRGKKQNVFDDFIAAAEYLCNEKYTRPSKLAIQGGSNGGLLVGAVMCQRPDLFGACLPAVGVMDMLRFNKFTAGRFWVDDYGSPENPEDFKALVAYSPYHNLKEGTKYPATLVTTADTDDRVVPGHSFKFIAQLQHCQAGPAPVLARIETRAGHGAGKPTAKLIEEVADQYAFVMKALGMEMR
jgi:prolyl oligopeptidase